MALDQSPLPTRYDLRFTIAHIPVRVQPLFWLTSFLLGISFGEPAYIVLWVGVVFLSILVHELGHALVMRWYGFSPRIVLHALGGATTGTPPLWGTGQASAALRPFQEVLVAAAGPLSGFLCAGLILLGAPVVGGRVLWAQRLLSLPWPYVFLPGWGVFLNSAVQMVLWVNLFWGMLNLAPVYPLDGGQIARHIWSLVDPYRGVRRSLWLSLSAAVLIAAAGLLLWHSTYLGLLFGFLAFQSYQALSAYRGETWRG